MAKAPRVEEHVSPTKRASSKLLIIIIAVVVVVVILAAGAVIFLKKGGHGGGDGITQLPEGKVTKREEAPIFLRLEAFTVKLQADADEKQEYLQLVPELRVLSTAAGDKIKLYMPEIRHNILLILSSKKRSDLAPPQGVNKLASEMLNRVNSIVDGEQHVAPPAYGKPRADDSVQEVLFTSFIIQ